MENNPIKLYRDGKGQTQEQFAASVGVKKAVVSKWEKGVPPSYKSALKLEEISEGRLRKEELRPDIWEPVGASQ
jgi:transcriptional regulator with XRE-family HTH domain